MSWSPWPSLTPADARWLLTRLGLVILLAGWAGAAWVWQTQGQGDPGPASTANPAAPLAPSDSRTQSRQVEIYYGKTGVLAERWSEALERLGHGKPLAETIAVLSLLGAGACFLVALRLRI